LAAANAAAPSSGAGPIFKDGVQITIQLASGGAQSAVTEVGLDIEATTSDAATRFGFHSLRAVADVDCARGVNRFVSAEAYDQPGFGGPGRPRTITGAWVAPTPDSFMAPVVARVCASQKVAAAGPPPVVKAMAPPAPPKVAAPQRAGALPKVTSPPPTASALPPAAPAPQVAAQPVPQAAPQLASADAPAAAPPSAPPPAPPLVVKMGAAAPPAPSRAYSPEPAPHTASYIPRVAGDRVAQVAASASLPDAQKVLRALKPLIAPPLTTSIEQAVVGAAHVYRADVVGFQTAADAKAFCRSAAQWSKTCWVRAKGDAPAAKPLAAKPAAPQPAEHLRAAKRAG
jgi:hypothetical protein